MRNREPDAASIRLGRPHLGRHLQKRLQLVFAQRTGEDGQLVERDDGLRIDAAKTEALRPHDRLVERRIAAPRAGELHGDERLRDAVRLGAPHPVHVKPHRRAVPRRRETAPARRDDVRRPQGQHVRRSLSVWQREPQLDGRRLALAFPGDEREPALPGVAERQERRPPRPVGLARRRLDLRPQHEAPALLELVAREAGSVGRVGPQAERQRRLAGNAPIRPVWLQDARRSLQVKVVAVIVEPVDGCRLDGQRAERPAVHRTLARKDWGLVGDRMPFAILERVVAFKAGHPADFRLDGGEVGGTRRRSTRKDADAREKAKFHGQTFHDTLPVSGESAQSPADDTPRSQSPRPTPRCACCRRSPSRPPSSPPQAPCRVRAFDRPDGRHRET